jgi:hypothetical protein
MACHEVRCPLGWPSGCRSMTGIFSTLTFRSSMMKLSRAALGIVSNMSIRRCHGADAASPLYLQRPVAAAGQILLLVRRTRQRPSAENATA